MCDRTLEPSGSVLGLMYPGRGYEFGGHNVFCQRHASSSRSGRRPAPLWNVRSSVQVDTASHTRWQRDVLVWIVAHSLVLASPDRIWGLKGLEDLL